MVVERIDGRRRLGESVVEDAADLALISGPKARRTGSDI